MKFAAKSLLFLMSLALTFAYAQTLPYFQHIIIVVQENRGWPSLSRSLRRLGLFSRLRQDEQLSRFRVVRAFVPSTAIRSPLPHPCR
jgi:hypothetical protein